mgnify:CR=1 FL=1
MDLLSSVSYLYLLYAVQFEHYREWMVNRRLLFKLIGCLNFSEYFLPMV